MQILPQLKTRLDYLDGLRALCALYVMIDHARDYSQGIPKVMPYLGLGPMAVMMFLAISGFCLALPVIDSGWQLSKSVGAFYLSRAWRILPPYYASIAFALIVGAVYGIPGETTPTWQGTLAHLCLVNNLTSDTTINPVYWSIALECQIYLLFPVLLWCVRRFGVCLVVGAGLAVGAILMGLMCIHGGDIPNLHAAIYLPWIGYFLTGVGAAYAYRKGVAWKGWPSLALASWSACLYLAAINYPTIEPRSLWSGLLFPVAGFSTLMIGTMPQSLAHRALSWKPLASIGLISYSIYLLHIPLIVLLLNRCIWGCKWINGPWQAFYALMLIGLPVVVLWSFLFWRFIEVPAMRLQKRLPNLWQRDILHRVRPVGKFDTNI